MRISDWSSDVCSSDLVRRHLPRLGAGGRRGVPYRHRLERRVQQQVLEQPPAHDAEADDRGTVRHGGGLNSRARTHPCAGDRKTDVERKSVPVRVDLGGRRMLQTKKNTTISTYTEPTQ